MEHGWRTGEAAKTKLVTSPSKVMVLARFHHGLGSRDWDPVSLLFTKIRAWVRELEPERAAAIVSLQLRINSFSCVL